MLGLLSAAWQALGLAGGAGGIAAGALALFAGFRLRAILITAAGGLVAAALIAGTFYVKGYAAARAAEEIRRLRAELAAERAVSADLRKQIAAANEIARRAAERAVEWKRKEEALNAQQAELERRLSDRPGGDAVCLDSGTAGMLDRIGR